MVMSHLKSRSKTRAVKSVRWSRQLLTVARFNIVLKDAPTVTARWPVTGSLTVTGLQAWDPVRAAQNGGRQ